ncbi:MAG: inositol 2-dehydrogenase [Flavobacteriaceae bacterium]|nr:inositol 2-dehydrogenase [Flavobacteriaceae bacterium]
MINFGIIGLGRIGKIHLSNVQLYCKDAQVLAASHVKPKHQAFLKENGVEIHFATFAEMLKHPGINAVIIASPTAFHYDHILLAAKAGKHIFCEKPIDLAYEKVKTIKETVAAAGIHFMVGFNRRFDPHIQQLKTSIDQGKVGSPRIVKITSRDPAPPPLKFIEHSGGLFLDMAIHDFDMARYLVGDEVVKVNSSGNIFGNLPLAQFDDIDTAVTTLIFKKGCMVQIDNSRYCAYGYDQRLEVFGENGKVATQNILENAVQTSVASGHHTARSKPFFIERYADSYRNILMDFVSTLKNKKASSISAEDGLAALAIAMAAKQSIKENRPISLS